MHDRDQLERGFRRLSVDHRAVVVLHHYLDMPLEAVAEIKHEYIGGDIVAKRQAARYLHLVDDFLGSGWTAPETLRFGGASALLVQGHASRAAASMLVCSLLASLLMIPVARRLATAEPPH